MENVEYCTSMETTLSVIFNLSTGMKLQKELNISNDKKMKKKSFR